MPKTTNSDGNLIGIVIDPYKRTVTERSIPFHTAVSTIRAIVGGGIEPVRLLHHDRLYVNGEAMLRLGGAHFPCAAFRFGANVLFGRGVIVAEHVDLLPRPAISAKDVSDQIFWLDAAEARIARAIICAGQNSAMKAMRPPS